MIYLGIDPGTSKDEPGGIGIIQELKTSTTVACWSMPSDNKKIFSLIREISGLDNIFCCIEEQQIFKGFDIAKARVLIMHYGALLMALEASGIEPHTVLPKVWQNAILGPTTKGQTKEVSLQLARITYPELGKDLKLAKDHGKADALHLAEYAEVMSRME